jgi:hypothetical protein
MLTKHNAKALIADADEAIPDECGNEFVLSIFKLRNGRNGRNSETEERNL